MRVFDCFPLFDELDILEIRLNEMAPAVIETGGSFVIVESEETYGGHAKPLNLKPHLSDRFKNFPIVYCSLPHLSPPCTGRTAGREREAYQRNQLLSAIRDQEPSLDDIISFGDCDEIPRATSVLEAANAGLCAITRLKQNSYYYNVNTLVDYGHDFASRARIGTWSQLLGSESMYKFRMSNKDTETFVIERAGWHFGYFGDLSKIKRKVAALSPFLSEYKLFGDEQLVKDIIGRRDLHHRRCELPETFLAQDEHDKNLPEYFLKNAWRFKHFTQKGQLS